MSKDANAIVRCLDEAARQRYWALMLMRNIAYSTNDVERIKDMHEHIRRGKEWVEKAKAIRSMHRMD